MGKLIEHAEINRRNAVDVAIADSLITGLFLFTVYLSLTIHPVILSEQAEKIK
jgi:hypothetical protein